MNLYNYFLTQQGSRIIKHAHYFVAYERYFERFRNTPVVMLEIGTGEGGSARMWKQYFGPLARIVTVDIRDCSAFAETQIHPRTGGQADAAFLQSLVAEFGDFDIILDDGSHLMADINATFDGLFAHLRSGGVYMVEDLNTAYWPSMGGGLGAPTSFIERAKRLVDEMHARHAGVASTAEGRSTFALTFFDSMVVIEKSAFTNTDMLHLPEPA